MLGLMLLGPRLERMLGRAPFALLYLGSGLARLRQQGGDARIRLNDGELDAQDPIDAIDAEIDRLFEGP